ncbi:GC-rich sequence DNA-binding factor-like protein-domain-containing protein [Pisolithus orientalis]|uniref:GC-rich sequence DNA-binding factor-like protein-domain-containing protein n=1 Tax=Pisolithus orientalis TaxID=936130 RepID=UPI002224AEBB|nr:GC-rich sequence DNA-binding factor-like protein-domain-containing protein [Pisolithus orientalis]KAI5999398.1 GC-rich sequence DNA-binding factor-like protein-domain-containing protein [Pisolithus orientalis]
MARRKRQLLEEETDSDASQGSDDAENAEGDRKRRRSAAPSFVSSSAAPAFTTGSSSKPATPPPPKEQPQPTPTAFASSFTTRSFMGIGKKPATPLPPQEQAHFRKIGNTFGARMLAKMGWEAGMGLGVSGEGIAVPIEASIRPKNVGIAFRGFKEKPRPTQEETEPGAGVQVDEQKQRRADVWKRPRKVKTKEIVAEATAGPTPPEVVSLAEVSVASWTPSTDPTRIPEERKSFIARERMRLQNKAADEAELISRLQQVSLVADEIGTKSKELSSTYEADLDDLSPLFSRLLVEFPAEFDKYHLDEIVVAAILPMVRRAVAQWNPLQDPSGLVSTLRGWKQALKVNSKIPMTPYESLLWNVWLPKVRTCINNEWSPADPTPAVKFYETWASFLPGFVRDNIMDQLILPKISGAIAGWDPKHPAVSLQTLVLPWLPHLARRKLRSFLRHWTPADGVPKDFSIWRDVFEKGDWDAMLLKHVIPKLGSVLREDFRVNPRNQDMSPLAQVLPWSTLIRPSVFSQLLEAEFFPKWLDILHMWLIQPRVSFEEVAQWYSFWKATFPENVQNMPGVARGFTRGLQLINSAIELGPGAPKKLERPDYRAELVATAVGPTTTDVSNPPKKTVPSRTQEVTFRSIVEDYAAEHNLLFIPTGRAHEKSRMPLFRVSNASGKGGILVYVQDDAVWAPERDEYRAITLEEMVLRVNK